MSLIQERFNDLRLLAIEKELCKSLELSDVIDELENKKWAMNLEYCVAEFLTETIVKNKKLWMTLNDVQDLRNEANPEIIPFFNEVENNLQCLCKKFPEIFELRNDVLYLSEAFLSIHPFSTPYSAPYSEQKDCSIETSGNIEYENQAVGFFKMILESSSPLKIEKLFKKLIAAKNETVTAIFSKYNDTEKYNFFKSRENDFIVCRNYVYLRRKAKYLMKIHLIDKYEIKLHCASLYLLSCFKSLHYFQLKQCISYVLEDVKYYLNQFSVIKQREIFTRIPLAVINESGFMELTDVWHHKPLDFRIQVMSDITNEEKVNLLIVCFVAFCGELHILNVLHEIGVCAPEHIRLDFCDKPISAQLQFIKKNTKYFKFSNEYISLHPYFVFMKLKHDKNIEISLPSKSNSLSFEVECDTRESISIVSNAPTSSVSENSKTIKEIQKNFEYCSESSDIYVHQKQNSDNIENSKVLTSVYDRSFKEQVCEKVYEGTKYSFNHLKLESNSLLSETDLFLESEATVNVSPKLLTSEFHESNQVSKSELVNSDKQKFEKSQNYNTISKSISISSEFISIKIKTCIKCIIKYLTHPVNSLILEAIFHIFEDCRMYFYGLSEIDQVKLIEDFFPGSICDINKISIQINPVLKFELSNEEIHLLVIAYLLLDKKRMHFVTIFKSLQTYCENVPDFAFTDGQQFNYFKKRSNFFVIENSGYVTLSNFSELKKLNFENICSRYDETSSNENSCSVHTSNGRNKAEDFGADLTPTSENIIDNSSNSFRLSPEGGFNNYYNVRTSNPFIDQACEETSVEFQCFIPENSFARSVPLSNELICAKMQKCVEYLKKYFQVALNSLLLEAILHILDDCRAHLCGLCETDQIALVKEAFSINHIQGKKSDCFSFTVQKVRLRKEEKNLLFITYFLVHMGKEHFSRIFKQFKEYKKCLPSSTMSLSEQFNYFKGKKKYFVIGNDGYVVLQSLPELINFINKFPSHVFPVSAEDCITSFLRSLPGNTNNEIKSQKNGNKQQKADVFKEISIPASVNCIEISKDLLSVDTGKHFENHTEINNSSYLLDKGIDKPQVILTSNETEIAKVSREYACARIQTCIAYLRKYFELTFDSLLLRAVLHVLEDSRSYFCNLSESDQICFIKECFRPFTWVDEKLLEHTSDTPQDCKLDKEEKDLAFIAYFLIYVEQMHFLKIFESFKEYGATSPKSVSSTSEKFSYFRKRKQYFCIGSDGYVTLNAISELEILHSLNFNCFKMSYQQNISPKFSLFQENQNQLPTNGITDHACTAYSYTYDKNLKFGNTNNISLTAKTDSEIVDAFADVNLAQSGNISKNARDKNDVFNKILSSNVFLSELLHEYVFDLDRLNIILHIFDEERKYFCNLSFTDQVSFIRKISTCFQCTVASSGSSKGNFNSVKVYKLSNRKRILLCITHLLYPNEKIHFLDLFKKIDVYLKLPEYLSADHVQFTYFRKEKKYFVIRKNGFVELSITPDSKDLNSEIFYGCFSPVDSGICISPLSSEQEEKNLVSTNVSAVENIIDLCAKILVKAKRMHFVKIFKSLMVIGTEEVQNFISWLSVSEKFKFFQNASHKFEIGNDGFVTLKTCTALSNISTSIGKREKSVNVDSTTHETKDVLPSNNLIHVSSRLTKNDENIQKSDYVTKPFILCDVSKTSDLLQATSDHIKKIDPTVDTSRSICNYLKEKAQIFDSSSNIHYSVKNMNILTDIQEDTSYKREKMKMPSTEETLDNSGSAKELEQDTYSKIIGISADIAQNTKSLRNEYVGYKLAKENPNYFVATEKDTKTENVMTITDNKDELHGIVNEKSVSVVTTSISEISKMYNWSAKNPELKQNIATSDSVSSTLNNFENQSELLKSIKTDTLNKVKNTVCPSNIFNDAIKGSQHVLSNISPVIKPDFHDVSSQKFSSISIPTFEKGISDLQRLPKQISKFVKYPTNESKMPISRTHKETVDMCLKTSTASLSDHCTKYSKDHDFQFITPEFFSFDNMSYEDYCSQIVDSFLGPLNLGVDHPLTSNMLEGEESSCDVSLCLREEVMELEEHSNFKLNKSEENQCFANGSFRTYKAHKHTEKERKVINFFIIILGKYSVGLPLQVLYTHLKIASKEVLEYLNHCYEDNLLHFFFANKRHFYVSPISHNVYLRQ